MLAISLIAVSTVVIATPTAADADTPTGTGTAIVRTVDARHPTVVHPNHATPAARAASTSSLPAKPSTGSRSTAKSAATSTSGPNSAAGSSRTLAPAVAPGVVASFDGLNEATGCGSCQPSNVNAAVGVAEIMEMVSLRFLVTDKTGAEVCDVGLPGLLGTDDTLTDARVLYDNFSHRYLLAASVVAANSGAPPAIWVAATTDDEACGIWNAARITFTGSAFPTGTTPSYPIIGQDRNALLVATDNLTPTAENFTAFGIPKAPLVAGTSFTFSAFATASRTAPVSNGGIPMFNTTTSYFLGSVPGAGYRVYRLTNPASTSATFGLVGTVSSAFSAPTRRVNQPGTSVTLDPSDGRINWSPVSDGTFIWFAHGISVSGFPTVRYGAINISTGALTAAVAYRSNTSDDFNPSVGVGNNPGGGNFIFVNWAYTDTPKGVATSVTVDAVTPHNGVPDLIGSGNVIVTGSSTTTETKFGGFSSVAIDPTASAGSCAVAAQQYFAAGGTWRTRVARVGSC